MNRDEVTGSKLGITIAAMVGVLMAMIDITIVNVALTDIRASFGTPLDQVGWCSTGYMMANIVVIPMTGWFQRRFGYRRYFASSVVLFTFASALCGLAWDLPSLVAFRVLQGLGGGAIIPTSNQLLMARYPRAQHGMASAMFGLGAVCGPLLGPSIGGYLIDLASWHWIFLVNVPVGAVICLLTLRYVHQPNFEPPRGAAARVDVFGIVLLALGMSSLQYVLEEGNREGWVESPLIVGLSAVAAVALVTFVVHELETDQPIVDFRIFAVRSYSAGTCLNFLTGFALFGGSYMFSLFAGSVVGYSALNIGKVFFVAGGVSVIMMPIIGRLTAKLDPRWLLALGVVLVSWSQHLASLLTQAAGFWDLVRPNMVRSFGLGFIIVPVAVVALSDVPAELRGNATGLFNMTRELGASIGTALTGTHVTNDIKRFTSYLSSHVTTFHVPVQHYLLVARTGLATRTSQPEVMASGLLYARVKQQALVLSFENGFRLTMLAMAFGIFMVLLLKRPAAASAPPADAH